MQQLTIVPETQDEGYPISSRRYPNSQRHISNIIRSPGRVHSTRISPTGVPDEFKHAQEKISPTLEIRNVSKVKSLTASPKSSIIFPITKTGINLENIHSPKSSSLYEVSSPSPSNRNPESRTIMLKLKDIKQGLNESNNIVPKRLENVNINVDADENDWKSIRRGNNVDEEMEKVRTLEAWQLGMIKDKISGSLPKHSEQYKSRNRSQDDGSFPNVNIQLIHTILAVPDEENKYKRPSLPTIMNDAIGSAGSPKKGVDLGEGSVQSLTNAIRETNQEILYDLISRKIKDFFNKTDVDQMTNEQLKLHTKTIAESVLEQFTALKGAANIVLIQNRIEYMIGRLKSSKTSHIDNMANNLKSLNRYRNSQMVMDYKSQESLLIRDFEKSLQNIKNLQEKVKNMNQESYKTNNKIKPLIIQLEQLNNKKDSQLTKKSSLDSRDSFRMEDVLQSVFGMENKPRRTRTDKKKMKADLENQIKGFQQELLGIAQQTQMFEGDLKTARNYKINYRMQLKDLYLKMLKDEATLVDINNTVNYTWPVRALMKMNEEVKSHIFPSFLDQTSINYFINYAKKLDELEHHCQRNNLMFLLSNSEEFKDTTNIFDNNQKNEDKYEKDCHNIFYSINLLGDLPQHGGTEERDFNSLLDKFKGKLTDLKKSNLKAKKLTQVTAYNSNGKQTVPKWEEVNPLKAEEFALSSHISKPEAILKSLGSSKLDTSVVRNTETPLDKALKIFENLKKMREEEITRITKQHLTKGLDEKQKLMMKKMYRFLFGRKEGEKGFYQWAKEKTSYDMKNSKQLNLHHPKQNEIDQAASPKNSEQVVYGSENQIWSGLRTDNLFSLNDNGLNSPTKANSSSKMGSFELGESVFKAAASKVLGV